MGEHWAEASETSIQYDTRYDTGEVWHGAKDGGARYDTGEVRHGAKDGGIWIKIGEGLKIVKGQNLGKN